MYIRCANVVLVNEEFRLQCTAGMALEYRMKRLGLEIPELAYNREWTVSKWMKFYTF
jgi:hypothetical protein